MDRYFERIRIGKMIAKIREEEGMSQIELAEKTGYTLGNILRIESGKYAVSIDILATVAEVLNRKNDLVSISPE